MALYCHLCLLLQNHRDNSYLQQHAGTYMYVSVATVEDVSRWGGGGGGGLQLDTELNFLAQNTFW